MTTAQAQEFSGVGHLMTAVGTHLGYSSWHEIDQNTIDAFAEATGDRQWIHTDPQRAEQGPFGSTIAHGFLTLSKVSEMLWEIYTITGVSLQINYGANKIRFPAAVAVGSRIRTGAQLVSLEQSDRGHMMVVTARVDIDGEAKPACVAELVTILR
ncbi:MAG: MaoC family dehydratase [Rhodococcus sp. (in: high G+C Gram-positive bacteria)]